MSFCSNCGSQVPEGNQFCESCGNPVKKPPQSQSQQQPPRQTQYQPQYSPFPQRPPAKSKKTLVAVILAIVVLLIAGVVTAAMLGVFQGPAPVTPVVTKPTSSVAPTNGSTTVPSSAPTQAPVVTPTTAPANISKSIDPIKTYYKGLISQRYAECYEVLSASNKHNAMKSAYLKWKNLQKKVFSDKSFKYFKVSEAKNKTIEKHKYAQVALYKIAFTYLDKAQNYKKVTDRFKVYTVLEDGKWKIHKTDFDIREDISYAYYDIGYMYETGKTVKRDYRKAIQNYKLTIKYNYKDAYAYHGIGYCYYNLKNYQKAILYTKKAIKYYSSKKMKSTACVLAGNIYFRAHKDSMAKTYYKKALIYNPKNALARKILKAY